MKKLLSLIFVLLFICLLGCNENDNDKPDLPRVTEDTSTAENTSIVGTYTFSHAFLRPEAEAPQRTSIGVPEADEYRAQKALQDALDQLASEWFNKAFRFNENGELVYFQRYTEEVYNTGRFGYDGKTLQLYSLSWQPYAPPKHVPVLEAEYDNDLLTIYFDESYGLTFTRVQDSSAS